MTGSTFGEGGATAAGRGGTGGDGGRAQGGASNSSGAGGSLSKGGGAGKDGAAGSSLGVAGAGSQTAGSSGTGGVNAGKGGTGSGAGGGIGVGGSVSTGGGAGGTDASGGTTGDGGSGGTASMGAGFGGSTGGVGTTCAPELTAKYASGPGVGQLPGPPAGAPAGDGAPLRFAIRRMFLGDTTFDGQSSPNAWKTLGLDLDGISSDKGFGCHCKAAAKQATSDIRTDGVNGIDNSFGNIIISQGTLPIENASQGATGSIEEGGSSLVLSFANLGSAPSYASVQATLIPVRMLEGQLPKFDQTDSWTPFAGGTQAPVVLDGGWVNDHTWVSPPTNEVLTVTIPVAGLPMSLPLRGARITAKLSPDRLRIERGIIAGVMKTEEYVDGMRELAGRLNLCGAAFESVAEQLRQSADSPLTGPHDAETPCEGISVGIGFQASRTGPLAAAVAPAPDGPNPCEEP